MAERKKAPLGRERLLALMGLVVAAFVFNTSEFMPVGLLSDIGASFGLSDAAAAVMITVYAWAVALFSLPLMVWASRIEYKRLLLAMVALFAAGQVASALAPAYPLLICARLLVAFAHAIFWSIVMIMAAAVAGPEHEAQGLGMVATGTSIAQICGMPLGRAVGLAVGWRMAFALVGVVALADLIFLARFFPELPSPERFTLSRLPGLLHNRPLVTLYVATVLMAGAHYVGYGYIEPYLAQVGGYDAGTITLLLIGFGAAGLLGSLLFSKTYEGHKQRFLSTSCALVAAALLMLLPAASAPALTICDLVVWGLALTSFGIAFQALIIDLTDPQDSSVAMAAYSGLYNLGIGAGTALGGAALTTLGMPSLGFIGGAIAAAGALVMACVFLPRLARA